MVNRRTVDAQTSRQRLLPRSIAGVAGLALMLAVAAVAAPTGLDAVATVEQTNRADAASQNRIDQLSAAARAMFEDYRQAITQTQQLQVYNRELEKIVAEQERRKAALAARMAGVGTLRAEVEPLMLRMIDTLERFVAADLPFLQSERMQRVADLRAAMANPELSVAERFRQVLAAYQAEAEYGRNMASYRGELTLNGRERLVEFLRIGRVMLFYITPDNGRSGYWDRQANAWKPLPARYQEAVRAGIRSAKDLAAPQLLALPVAAPQPADSGAGEPKPAAVESAS